MRELPRDLVTILLTEARNQRTPPVDYVVAEDGGRMVRRPEPNIAMAELLEEAAAALAAREPAIPDGFVEELAESYTFYADDGRTHTPEDHEREMLVDFGHSLIAEYVAHLDAEHAPAARSGGLKPLDENDYEGIVNAATIRMRKAMSGARGQMITVQDGLDWWIMKETERRVLAAIGAADPAPAAKPVAWLHEMKEPDSKSSILSRSPENPFGHWLEKYREQCTYSITPLYASPSPSDDRARIAAQEARLAEMRKALEPFALVAEHDIAEDEADGDTFRPMPKPFSHAPQITVGHLRAARRALEGGRK